MYTYEEMVNRCNILVNMYWYDNCNLVGQNLFDVPNQPNFIFRFLLKNIFP